MQDMYDDNQSIISGAETDTHKEGVEWQYDENNTELDFGIRTPMEEIETGSLMSKRRKGYVASLLSSHQGR